MIHEILKFVYKYMMRKLSRPRIVLPD